MNKKLFILSSMLLVGIYANSMQLTPEELKSLLKKNDPHNHKQTSNEENCEEKCDDKKLEFFFKKNYPNNHKHTSDNENCGKKCDLEKIKILKKIKEINKLIIEKKIDQKLGKKQIKEIKSYWNQEHPENQIKNNY